MNKVKLTAIVGCLILGTMIMFSLPASVAANSHITASFTVQLTISKLAASVVSAQSVIFSWETNGEATSQVFWDQQSHDNLSEYSFSSGLISPPATRHSVQIYSLSPSTLYHYRVKSVATVGINEFTAVSENRFFQTGAPSVDGYGGWSPDLNQTVALNGLSTTHALILNAAGIVQTGTHLITSDGNIQMEIPAGTRILSAQAQPPNSLTASRAAETLPVSRDKILQRYNLSPESIIFTPSIKMTMKYDPAALPLGTTQSSLYIAYWDGSQWQALQSTVDMQARTVSAMLSRLAPLALFSMMPAPVSSPAPLPSPSPAPTTVVPEPQLTPSQTSAPVTATPAVTTTTIPASLSPVPSTTITATTSVTPVSEPGPAVIKSWWIAGCSAATAVLIILTGWLLAMRRRRR